MATEARYKGDITAGSLKVPESRVVAGLLLRGAGADGWKDAIVRQNVLKARTPATATRLAKLIRGRLETMGPDLWKLVRDGKGSVAFGKSLSNRMWDDYLDGCRGRDPDMPEWSESTRKRLRSSVFQTLAQAGYVENTRTLKLQPVHVADPVARYLADHGEEYVLRCLRVAQ